MRAPTTATKTDGCVSSGDLFIASLALVLAIPCGAAVLALGAMLDPATSETLSRLGLVGLFSGLTDLASGIGPETLLFALAAIARALFVLLVVPPVLVADPRRGPELARRHLVRRRHRPPHRPRALARPRPVAHRAECRGPGAGGAHHRGAVPHRRGLGPRLLADRRAAFRRARPPAPATTDAPDMRLTPSRIALALVLAGTGPGLAQGVAQGSPHGPARAAADPVRRCAPAAGARRPRHGRLAGGAGHPRRRRDPAGAAATPSMPPSRSASRSP